MVFAVLELKKLSRFQIPQRPLKGLLVAMPILPSGEVANVAVAA